MNKSLRMILISFLLILLIFYAVPWIRFAAFILFPDSSFGKQDVIISPLYLGYYITFISILIASVLSMSKSRKTKYKVWGIAIIVPISLPLAYSIGITYSFIVENPWATMLLIYVFPIISIIGCIILLIGIFSKDKALFRQPQTRVRKQLLSKKSGTHSCQGFQTFLNLSG